MNIRAFAASHCDIDILQRSSSGGVFTALSDVALKEGGIVVACQYNYDVHRMQFVLFTDKDERDRCRGSKYIAADMGDIYSRIIEALSEGHQVMFFGLPCQVAGLKSFLMTRKANCEELCLVDIVCHGVASSMVWSQYVKCIEKTSHSMIVDVSFKDKRNGWLHPTPRVKLEDNSEEKIYLYCGPFNEGLTIRPSCFMCGYKEPLSHKADITIGDFWGIDEKMPEACNPMGTSLVLTYNEVGEKWFGKCSTSLIWKECPVDIISQKSLEKALECPANREKFWRDMRTYRDFIYLLKKYNKLRLIDRVKRKLRLMQ